MPTDEPIDKRVLEDPPISSLKRTLLRDRRIEGCPDELVVSSDEHEAVVKQKLKHIGAYDTGLGSPPRPC